MRYPKFILCDNMEDKGMEKERTQNLQNLIVKISESFKDSVAVFTPNKRVDSENASQVPPNKAEGLVEFTEI
jgi:hypothetical protein